MGHWSVIRSGKSRSYPMSFKSGYLEYRQHMVSNGQLGSGVFLYPFSDLFRCASQPRAKRAARGSGVLAFFSFPEERGPAGSRGPAGRAPLPPTLAPQYRKSCGHRR